LRIFGSGRIRRRLHNTGHNVNEDVIGINGAKSLLRLASRFLKFQDM
jgi:hypothetical protein